MDTKESEMGKLDNKLNEAVKDDPKKKKFVILFKARMVLSKIGTMQELSIARKQLKRMKRLGLKSV